MALSGLAALAGCAAPGPSVTPEQTAGLPATPAKFLKAADVEALYRSPHREDGVVLSGSHAGAHWTKWTNPDGTAKLVAGHGLFTDTGHLGIVANEVCVTWNHIDGGKESCVHLARIGPDTFVSYGLDGVEGSKIRITTPGAAPD